MKEFLLIFRREVVSKDAQPSPDKMQAMLRQWQDWMGSLAAQNKLANPGNRLESDGRVVKPAGILVNGPYVEIKEAIGGYIILRASSIDEAAELSKGCPALTMGGNVEVRPILVVNG